MLTEPMYSPKPFRILWSMFKKMDIIKIDFCQKSRYCVNHQILQVHDYLTHSIHNLGLDISVIQIDT
jgi:hypothetical protein